MTIPDTTVTLDLANSNSKLVKMAGGITTTIIENFDGINFGY